MTGKFSDKDPERCVHYARFFQHLTLPEANGIFWLLFIFVLIMMCISSLQHHKSIALTERDKSLPPRVVNSTSHKLKNRRLRVKMLSIASLCLILSAAATVFECFALFNIEFCDGEDLMQMYWGFWSVLQVGSNIAILGVMVQFWIVLGDVETPSWAVALGTPVLVFAALGFVFRAIGKNVWGKFTGKREEREKERRQSDDEESGVGGETDDDGEGGQEKGRVNRSLSTAPTIVNDDSRYASPSPPPGEASNDSNNSRPQPSPRGPTVWSRDLQYLLSSVVHGEHDQSPREFHIHHHHHGRQSRGREHHGTGALSAPR
ncbi:hypothetical protein ONS96_014790 [Cadophora gregata f. sp. sojae]|nr:hypothetical protein ONS96_014790 [Cadophora gregata f. sp. sojae]